MSAIAMRTDLFDFDLPPERIALRPAIAARFRKPAGGAGRRRAARRPASSDLPQWLEPGDQLVVNDTRVIAAQLNGRRIGRGDRAEDRGDLDQAARRLALAGAGRSRPRSSHDGDSVRFGNEGRVCLLGHLDAEVEAKGEDGEVTLSFSFHGPMLDQAIADLGDDAAAALHRLKARRPTSRMPPTTRPCSPRRGRGRSADRGPAFHAGARSCTCARRGAEIKRVTLHVGAGTFLPVKAEETADHRMHAEWGVCPAETAAKLNDARRAKAGASSRSARPRCGCSRARDRGRWHHPRLRRRHLDLHHAGLPLPRRRYAADQLPPAALDPVHAGVGLFGPRRDEGRPMRMRWRTATGSIRYGDAQFVVPGVANRSAPSPRKR